MEALLIKKSYTNNSAKLDDLRLTEMCKANDAFGQRAMYDTYVNTMCRLCMRYLADEMEAEDAMITGFVKVFSKINTFEYRGKGSLEGWVRRIMVNECLMVIRRKKHEIIGIDQVSNYLQSHANLDSNLFAEEIINTIQKLPQGYRTVFNMYVIEGFNHKEIGVKLGISENTSKSQLSKARNSLKQSLTKLGAL